MDVKSPEMSGLKATRHDRQRQQQKSRCPNYKTPLIIVAMTANAMQGDKEKCLAAGMDDYLSKPVRLEDVRAIVERWGAIAAATEPAPETNGARPCGAASAQSAAADSASGDAPVEMERLLDFTDGNPEN